jgi:hypothetical protein
MFNDRIDHVIAEFSFFIQEKGGAIIPSLKVATTRGSK